jgi:sulfur carrier protein
VNIVVNGEGREIPDQTTVRGLIELLDLGGGPVAVERNGEIVPRADHPSTALAEADVIEIVHFVGGG